MGATEASASASPYRSTPPRSSCRCSSRQSELDRPAYHERVEPTPPKIKFCGITRLVDAERAASAGAWAIGLILWPGSPRRCDPALAAEISAAVKRRLEVVGVFVNPSLDELAFSADAI